MNDPKIQEMLEKAKDASAGEKLAVYGSALWVNSVLPGVAVYGAVHEGMHSLASLLLGEGVETYSVLPPVYSDRLEKRHDLKGFKWKSIEDARMYLDITDHSENNRRINYLDSLLRAGFSGTLAYTETRTPLNQISRPKRALLTIAPYALDTAFLAAANGRIGEAVFNSVNSGSLFFDYSPDGMLSKYTIGIISASSGATVFGAFGMGDFAEFAKAIIPQQRNDRWYKKFGRGLIAGGLGSAIVYTEIKFLNRGVNNALQGK